MERSDIAQVGARSVEAVIAGVPVPTDRLLLRITSGTSGREPVMLATTFAARASSDASGPGGSESTTLCFLGRRSARLAHALVVRSASVPLTTLAVDLSDLSEGFADVIAEYRPDMLYGFPSAMAQAFPFFKPEDARRIRVILTTGESIGEHLETAMRRTFPNAVVQELYMASDTAGHIGARLCPHLPKHHFHIPEFVTVEIDEPDETGVGDILITKELLPGIAIERYRIGDLGRIIEAPCACGAARSLEFVGRKGIDYMKLFGAILRREEFDRVMRYFGFVDDYRVDVKRDMENGLLRGDITLRVYSKRGAGTPALREEIARRVSENLFVTANKTLGALVSEGRFAPLKVEFADAPFSSGHKDIKIRLHSQ